jgi:hypothetical protein
MWWVAGHIMLTVHFLSQFVDVGTMVSPTVFARRSLAYLLSDQAEAALRDAMQAQYVHPEWPTAFYMQAAALAKLGMETDANDMLKEGAALDSRRQNSWSKNSKLLSWAFLSFLLLDFLPIFHIHRLFVSHAVFLFLKKSR